MIENRMTVGKARLGVCALDAMSGHLSVSPSAYAQDAKRFVDEANVHGCRWLWDKAKAEVQAAVATADDVDVLQFFTALENDVMGRREFVVPGAPRGWASRAFRELFGDRWSVISGDGEG